MRNRFCSLLMVAWAVSSTLPGSPTSGPAPVEQACSVTTAGAADVTFSWPSAPGAQEVWVDLSPYSLGLDAGVFTGVGPFASNVTSYTWQGIPANTQYYYRVNARYADGWHALKLGSFVSGQCGAPSVPLQSTTQDCSGTSPTSVSINFAWSPSLIPGATQWLDLSIYDNDFAGGTFLGKGPLPAGQSTYTWEGLPPGLTYYWRVNTQTPNGWVGTPTWSVSGIRCGRPAPASPDLLQLRDSLAAAVADSGIDAAVAVTDLQTGESIDVRGDVPRYAGCTLNWFVLLSNVVDVQNGLTPESDVGDLIARTIYGSNPFTAHDLLIRTGGDVLGGTLKVDDLIARLGLKDTFFDHPPGYEDWFSLRGQVNTITANDINRALAIFYHGGVVDPPWRDYLLQKMTGVKPGLQYLIPAGVGDGVVSHKNGFSWMPGGYIDNDIGIVQFDSSAGTRAYAISFYTQDVPVEYQDIPLGQSVSRMVWDFFSSRYP
ncbi:MAG: serine hydrolase [Dehalococcoidia bacterium]